MTEVRLAILGTRKALATIAVKDVEIARKFYQEILGLEPSSADESGVVMLASANTMVLLYESQYAGTNKATAVTWPIEKDAEGGIEAVVAALKERGVGFEHYDFPGCTREGDVHVFGMIKSAWFKDPDGNILSIVSES